MKFERMTGDAKAMRRRKLEIDNLAKRDRDEKVRGKIKKLASEGLRFGACCLLGACFGVAGCLIIYGGL